MAGDGHLAKCWVFQQDCSNKPIKEHVHSSCAQHIQIDFKNYGFSQNHMIQMPGKNRNDQIIITEC